MENANQEKYTQELEESIIELKFKLRNKDKELKNAYESNQKIIGKLVHNLKNPIGIAYSFSEMIMEGASNYDTEKLKKHLQIIRDSANFSLSLLDQFSMYTSLQSPDYQLTKRNTNYTELIKEVVNEFSETANKKQVKIITENCEKDLFLNIDKEEISKAIRNIIDNAIRFSEANTTIKIAVTEKGKSVETIISDEGIGISAKDLPHIFSEFYVINTYSNDKQKCIGLGLTIAKKIIEFHQGKITVESESGKGTSFKISLIKK